MPVRPQWGYILRPTCIALSGDGRRKAVATDSIIKAANEVDSWNDKKFRMLKKTKQILYQDKSDDHNSNLVDNTYSRSTMACRCSASTETTVFNFFLCHLSRSPQPPSPSAPPLPVRLMPPYLRQPSAGRGRWGRTMRRQIPCRRIREGEREWTLYSS